MTTANLGLIALTRFGYGPHGDGDVVSAGRDPRGFLRAEIEQPDIALLSGADLPSSTAAAKVFFELREQRKAARDARQSTALEVAQAHELAALSPVFGQAALSNQQGPVAKGALKQASPAQIIFRDEALARLRRADEARVGFAERLVAFWSNHFCISAAKGGFARVTAGAFEREAIRPHVFGRFADMLVAVESHPAMLHFLDNQRSVGPDSKAGLRGDRGLNENLGREIMELHTLGVDGGYAQADVTHLAGILTGWTYAGAPGRLGAPGSFVFNAAAHEPGSIELLGRSYPDEGVEMGRSALLDLASRPQAARFIAKKFAAAFVSDPPPARLVERLTATFATTHGDLRALTLALLDAPESWSPAAERVRTPWELVVGSQRLLGHVPEDGAQIGRDLLGPLTQMGMPLWQPPGPNGFPLAGTVWASPEGMKLRLDWSAALAARLKDPPNPNDLLDALTGGAPSPQTRQAVARAESRQQGIALLLMSPEMQRS